MSIINILILSNIVWIVFHFLRNFNIIKYFECLILNKNLFDKEIKIKIKQKSVFLLIYL